MPRSKSNMNVIYMSERMQECLRHISESDITIIVAPMGYGKTTAADWFLKRRRDQGDMVLRISIYSDNRELFWKSFRRAFQNTPVGNQMQEMEFPSTNTALGLLSEFLQGYLSELRQYYLFIDDYHLMNDLWIVKLLLVLSRSLATLHIVVASREAFLSRSEEVQLGQRLHKIGINDLRMNPTELSIYSRRCGVAINSQQIAELDKISEGWFSAVYLNLKSFSQYGTFLTGSHDIYEMLNDSLLIPLQKNEREFLIGISLADEFTLEQARFITGLKETEEIAKTLSQSNAFVQLLPDGKTYRLHHMLKECMNKQLEQMSIPLKMKLHDRYGAWHESQKEYIRSLNFYMNAGNNTAVLHIIGIDAGVQLASIQPEKILHWLEQCTEDELIGDPCGLLVLMRRLFSWRKVPQMLRIKELLLKAAENSTLAEKERNNLLGECDLIMSFLGYNDIAAMSRLHRSACQKMTRQAISIQKHGSWTFGSPSVLMMFHREAGKMNDELQVMQESMPYYNRITDDQGIGAEYVMEAEVRYCRGEFVDAHIALEKARTAAKSKGQQYIMLCCDFLALRMTLCGIFRHDKQWYETKRCELKQYLDPMLLTVLDGCYAYFCALIKKTKSIPEWILNGDLNNTNLLHPARPMYEIIFNQILLAEGDFVRLLGRGEELLKLCGIYPYTLCSLHLHIQQAAAYENVGKRREAVSELKEALAIAVPDGCMMPFIENYYYIKELIQCIQGDYSDFVEQLKKMANEYIKQRDHVLKYADKVPEAECLTETEYRICELMAAHKTNRDIASEMFLSEGTIKQYMNQIYSKLGIDGNMRDKRKRTVVLLFGKN